MLTARWVVGGVFLYASLDKIADPASFAQAVYNYRLLPLSLLHPFALLLPWLEAVAGLALIAGVWWRGAALLCSVLTLTFTLAVASALLRQLDISCGCFHTTGGASVGMSLLWRDLLLLVACLGLLLIHAPGHRTQTLPRREV
jgi:uncharacterized membrane protein YphA (DoxX/SURF4 family)